MNKQIKIVLSLLALSFSNIGLAETHTVGQKERSFTVSSLKVKLGDIVNFVNEDSIFHNVFSLSDAKLFDLGSYPKGEYKSVTFDEVGVVEIECAIHPDMQMEVIVE